MMNYLLILLIVGALLMKVESRFGFGPVLQSRTPACEPASTLYTGVSDGTADRLLLEREVSALSYNVGEDVGGVGKRLANVAMYTLLVGAGALAAVPVVGPVLAVFAAAATIIAGEAFPDENADNIANLEKAMSDGFKKLRDDMNQKFLDVEHYIDASIQASEVRMLASDLEVDVLLLF